MNIKLIPTNEVKKTGSLIIPIFEDIPISKLPEKILDTTVKNYINKTIKQNKDCTSIGKINILPVTNHKNYNQILILGLGNTNKLSINEFRINLAESIRRVKRSNTKSLYLLSYKQLYKNFPIIDFGQVISESTTLGLYQFNKYKTKSTKISIQYFYIIEENKKNYDEINQGISNGEIISNSVNLCRDLVNEPANYMTPTQLAEEATEISINNNISIKILETSDMKKLGMGAILGVAQGSNEPPKFIIMRYEGDPKNKSNQLGIIGKGITFDSGGISIKPSRNMGDMKGDMAGAAAVISSIQAISKLKLKINVTSIAVATENMPGGKAQRPGDVVKTFNGKTIEIDNTDAEGRLVLADAVAYANSIGIKKIIDIATLTGAIRVALGNICTGAFGNNKKFTSQLIESSINSGENIWELPIYKEYKEQYQSDIADIKNTGGMYAGATTGAMIIGEFVGDSSWIHLDIAGTSTTNITKGYNIKGATGIPVRTIVDLAKNLQSKK